MSVTLISNRHFMLFLCWILLGVDQIHTRTTPKSRRHRTTPSKPQSTPSTPTSLLDLPQNDIYNNKVEEDVGMPTLPVTSPYTRAEKSRISWEMLQKNQNGEKGLSRKYAQQKILLRGPTGPRGPPGALVTQDDLVKQFKKMVKNAANKKARKIIQTQCPSCDVKGLDNEVLSFFYPGVDDKIRTVNRAPMAFTTRLLNKITIYPEKRVQLKRFQLTGSENGLLRGVPAELGINGRFPVDKSGIYQFTATINVHSRHKVDTKLRSNYVEVSICVNGQCTSSQSNKNPMVTQYKHSMESRQRYFTIQLVAMLQLKKSDSVSIYVENACRRTIDVQEGSLMAGIILSV